MLVRNGLARGPKDVPTFRCRHSGRDQRDVIRRYTKRRVMASAHLTALLDAHDETRPKRAVPRDEGEHPSVDEQRMSRSTAFGLIPPAIQRRRTAAPPTGT